MQPSDQGAVAAGEGFLDPERFFAFDPEDLLKDVEHGRPRLSRCVGVPGLSKMQSSVLAARSASTSCWWRRHEPVHRGSPLVRGVWWTTATPPTGAKPVRGM